MWKKKKEYRSLCKEREERLKSLCEERRAVKELLKEARKAKTQEQVWKMINKEKKRRINRNK